MMDFDQVEHAIEEGYIGVKEKMDIFCGSLWFRNFSKTNIEIFLNIPAEDEP